MNNTQNCLKMKSKHLQMSKFRSGADLKLDVKSSCLKVKHAIIAQQDLPDTVRETTLDFFEVLLCIL